MPMKFLIKMLDNLATTIFNAIMFLFANFRCNSFLKNKSMWLFQNFERILLIQQFFLNKLEKINTWFFIYLFKTSKLHLWSIDISNSWKTNSTIFFFFIFDFFDFCLFCLIFLYWISNKVKYRLLFIVTIWIAVHA